MKIVVASRNPVKIGATRAAFATQFPDAELELLPIDVDSGAGDQPVLPLFLTQYTWVDLRAGLTEAGLDRLEWGITGVKPRKIARRG